MTMLKYGKLELPDPNNIVIQSLGTHKAKFTIGPFERGYAHTLGNALRRIMLTSIEAPAIISVRIEGISHEYEAKSGIKEDMIHIILNFKNALLSKHNLGEHNDPREVRTVKKSLLVDSEMIGGKQFPVTMGHIFEGSDYKVIDPNFVLFTVTRPMEKPIEIELKIGTGRGYVPAERHEVEPAIEEILIDSCFSPVRMVNYHVENTRVGQDTDYDQLILEVTTDGRVEPLEALTYASQIAIHHFDVLTKITGHVIHFDKGSTQTNRELDELRVNLSKSIQEIELSVRSENCLKQANIKTIYDLVVKDEPEMLKYRNFGKKSLNEIKEKLAVLGLSLGMKSELDKRHISAETIQKNKEGDEA
jgi:DNA-directed RNA polymerase subunit alpha